MHIKKAFILVLPLIFLGCIVSPSSRAELTPNYQPNKNENLITGTPTSPVTAQPLVSDTPLPSAVPTTKIPLQTITNLPSPTIDVSSIQNILAEYPMEVGMERIFTVTITYTMSMTEEDIINLDSWHGLVHEEVVGGYNTPEGVIYTVYSPDYPDVYSFPFGGGTTGPHTEIFRFFENQVLEHNDIIYDFPLYVGKEWLAFPDLLYKWTVSSNEDITTPAGHFDDCYVLSLITGPDSTEKWFCRGIGLVRLLAWHHPAIWIEDWRLLEKP